MITVESVAKQFLTAPVGKRGLSFKRPPRQYVKAVQQVSFFAPNGRITGLLGPNGAGKTTTLRMLAGLITPDAGSMSVDGIDVVSRPREALARMGVLSDARGLYPRLTARENIVYYGVLQGMSRDAAHARAETLAMMLEMAPLLERRTDGFSQGERMKTALARALVHDPANIVLDEPTNGLDVLATRALRDALRLLRTPEGGGKCIVFSTHIMQEVERLCDSVIVMAHGRTVASGTVQSLLAQTGERRNEFRERLCNLVARPREEARFTASDVRLGANPIVFVFYRRVFEIAQRFFRRLDGTRQHEVNRMEDARPGFRKFADIRQQQGFTDIAEQHVRALDLVERDFECLRNRLFHQTFFKANAKISADDLDDVLGLDRHGLLKQITKQESLGRRPTRGSHLIERCLHVLQRQDGLRFCRQNIGSDRSRVAMPAIAFGEILFGFPGKLSNRPPQERTANLQSRFLVSGEWASRKKESGDGRGVSRQRLQVVRDNRGFLQLLGGRGYRLASLGKAHHPFLDFTGPAQRVAA